MARIPQLWNPGPPSPSLVELEVEGEPSSQGTSLGSSSTSSRRGHFTSVLAVCSRNSRKKQFPAMLAATAATAIVVLMAAMLRYTKGKDKGKDDDQSQVNETSRTEIVVEKLKTFYEICQRENISPDDTFKEIEKWILAQDDPKLCITEQLNKENDKIQNDLKEINKKLLKIHEEIINTGNKALRNVRKETENKRNELEKKRDALEIDENLVNELKEIISKPTVDLMKPMIDLCDMKIEEMSAAHKIQEEEAYEWVKTVLERKVLQAHTPAGHSLSPLHPRGVPHSRGIGFLPHQSAAQRQGRIYTQSSPFSPGQHNGSTPRGAVSEERLWRDRPGSAPVYTDPPQQLGRAREWLEGGKELRERKKKVQEEMINIIIQFSSFLECESTLGKSYSEMKEMVNKKYESLVERFNAFGVCDQDLEELKKKLNQLRLTFLSKYPLKSNAATVWPTSWKL